VTKAPDRINLPKLEGFQCFACGSANPIGLHMSFYLEKDEVCSKIVLNENHSGWDIVAHGGILTTLLDEVMSWTFVVFNRAFFLTKSMEIRFLRPVQVNVPLLVQGRIESTSGRKSCRVAGTIYDFKGSRLTRAWADIVFLPEKRRYLIQPRLRDAMERFFEQVEDLM